MSLELTDKFLLAWYGCAVLECNKVETYVTEIIKQKNKLPNTKLSVFFGHKIDFLEKIVQNKDLISKLKKINKDRVFLAHGFAIKHQDEQIYLVIKDKNKVKVDKLTEQMLKNIFLRAESVSYLLIELMEPKLIKF